MKKFVLAVAMAVAAFGVAEGALAAGGDSKPVVGVALQMFKKILHVGWHLTRASRYNPSDRRRRQAPGQSLKRPNRRLIGPVDIIDDHRERSALATPLQQIGEFFE